MTAPQPRSLNVLLLLSNAVQPPPEDEVVELAEACQRDGHVHLATTRAITGLTKDSEVAFYTDGPDAGRLLAVACYRGFIAADGEAGQQILDQHHLYGKDYQPFRMRGFLRLADFRLAACQETVAGLGGYAEDGRRLGPETVPPEPQGASVYYVKGSPPSAAETAELLRKKVAELEDKYAQTRTLWESEMVRQQRATTKRIDEFLAVFEDEMQGNANGSAAQGGTAKRAITVLRNLLAAMLPNLELLQDSAEVCLERYADSRTLMEALNHINADPLMGHRLLGAKAVKGAGNWIEKRFADNLGRLYFRTVRGDHGPRAQVLVSVKTSQTLDIDYLRSL